ncbi:MAG: hypothetical protein CMO80_02970 [Verrucomicrobiales bacterium]|nr:hypothetical protein [Verrucomicrobiales bacterium]
MRADLKTRDDHINRLIEKEFASPDQRKEEPEKIEASVKGFNPTEIADPVLQDIAESLFELHRDLIDEEEAVIQVMPP